MTSRETGEEPFLARWSRLKEEARVEPPEPIAAVPLRVDAKGDEAPLVPPVDELSLASDYRPFFHPKIEEGVRRAALKKLFSDPHFNIMDGLDVYIDDYSKSDPLPEGMLEQLEQAKKILAWSREDAEERARVEARNDAAAIASAVADDMSPLQDSVPPAEAGAGTSSTTASVASGPDSTQRVE